METTDFQASKDIVNRVKGQPTKQEKRFAYHISDKGINIQNILGTLGTTTVTQ